MIKKGGGKEDRAGKLSYSLITMKECESREQHGVNFNHELVM